jgi:hypothetical protein
MKSFRFFLLLGAAIFAHRSANAQDNWEWRSPTPSGNRVANFAYAHGLFVGVGELGTILTSPDGAQWTPRSSGTSNYINRVATDGARFVAVTSDSILTSTDGITWARRDGTLYDITFGNGLFVAFARPATIGSTEAVCEIRTSPDGITWTARQSFSHDNFGHLEFANGTFVAPDTGGGVITSTDGFTWTQVAVANIPPTTPFFAAGNNRFLLSFGSSTYVSTNGTSWREVTAQLPGHYTQTVPVPNLGWQSTMGFGGGYFYIQQRRYADDAYMQYRSADGETWASLNTSLNNFDFSTLASGGGVVVATEVPRTYYGANSHSFFIHSSTDGLTWTDRSTILLPPSDHAWPVYGLGRFFVNGKTSNDGLTWSECGFEPTHAAGDRLFRIVSLSWSGSALPDITSSGSTATTVEVSSDGLSSVPVDVGMRTPRSVAFGKGRYVMVGEEGKISVSTNAISWTPIASPTAKKLNAVLFAFDRFAAAGEDGTLLFSADGLTWDDSVSPRVAGLQFSALAANSVGFVAVASASPTDAPSGVTAPANIPVQFATGNAFRSVVTLNDTFVAASFDGDYYHGVRLSKSTDGKAWVQVPLSLGPSNFGKPLLATGNGTALLAAPVGITYSTSTYFALLQTPAIGSVSPTITHPPVAKSAARGESVAFAVGVTGTGPLSYQWYHGAAAIADATQPVLQLSGLLDADAGDYSVKVTNAVGSATSSAATLTVTTPVPLAITQQPVGGTLLNGTDLVLAVKVTGSGPITYQWRRNGTAILNSNSSTYEIFGFDIAKDSQVGSYDVVVTAPYSSVTSQVASVVWAGPSVEIVREGTGSYSTGETATLKAVASGAGPFTYRWYTPGGSDLVGATDPTLRLPFLTPADSSPYWVEVTDANGQTVRAVTTISVTGSAPADKPTVAAVAGQDITLRVGLVDTHSYLFQWRHNGQPIAGATGASYTIRDFSTADEGSFDVVVTAPDGSSSVRSEMTLTLESSRLVNLSARGFAGNDEATLIQGFVLHGTPSIDSPDVLIRSIGPTLASMGVKGVLADPSLQILSNDHAIVAENDNWSTGVTTARGLPATSKVMARFGAFPVTAGTRDSAVLIHQTNEGVYHTVVSAVGGGSGFVLNEVYGPVSGTQRLVNLSARAQVGSGDNVLIAGFVISGKTPLKVLIRGVGPTLSGLGITHPLANPKLTLFNAQGHEIHNNDTWGQAANAAAIRTTATTIGAFALKEDSNDAAILETLDPGVYTALLTSVDGSSGIALVEIYEVP